MIYKFTNTNHDITNSPYFNLYNYYKNGGTYKKDAEYHLYTCKWDNGTSTTYSRITEDLLYNGCKMVMGWRIDFRDIWNCYLVNLKNEGWVEFYAPCKMAIRDTIGNHKIVGKIIQL